MEERASVDDKFKKFFERAQLRRDEYLAGEVEREDARRKTDPSYASARAEGGEFWRFWVWFRSA